MVKTTTVPDAWNEIYKFSVQRKAGSIINMEGLVSEISALDFGEKDFEGIALGNGGRVRKMKPMTDETITLKVWPTDVGLSGDGVAQFFHPQTADDITQPLSVSNTITKNQHQIILLFAESMTGIGGAGSATPAGCSAYRIIAKNALLTRYKPDFGDLNLSAEISFKWAPFDKDGTSNKTEDSTDGTAVLTAVASYT